MRSPQTALIFPGLLAVIMVGAPNVDAGSSRYSARILIQMSGGKRGPIHVGEPLDVWLRDRRRGHAHYRVCWDPPPISRPACTGGRIGGEPTTGAPSKAGTTTLRFTIKGKGEVLSTRLRVQSASKIASKTTRLGLRKVCAKHLYVDQHPGLMVVIGTLFKNEHMRVRKLSASGRYAYGMAYGHVNHNGWVKTSGLCT